MINQTPTLTTNNIIADNELLSIEQEIELLPVNLHLTLSFIGTTQLIFKVKPDLHDQFNI